MDNAWGKSRRLGRGVIDLVRGLQSQDLNDLNRVAPGPVSAREIE